LKKKLFSLQTVHPSMSPSSTLWARPFCERGLGQDFAHCLLFPHQKQALEGWLPGPLCGFLGEVWCVCFSFWRMETNIWYYVWACLSLNCLASLSLLLKTLKAVFINICWGVW
jgi:hypothetical protein